MAEVRSLPLEAPTIIRHLSYANTLVEIKGAAFDNMALNRYRVFHRPGSLNIRTSAAYCSFRIIVGRLV